MLRAALICPDKDLGDRLEEVLQEVGRVRIVRWFHHYPEALDMARFLRVHAPEVLFLNVESASTVRQLLAGMESQIPGLQVVALSRACDSQVLLELMRCGIREFLTAPFDSGAVGLAIDRMLEQQQRRPASVERSNLVFSFLPAKAGVGASILAANAAHEFSHEPGHRTLLADFDLNSGILRFLLKLTNPRCIVDAAGFASQMDDSIWPQVVTPLQQLDVVHAGSMNPGFRFEPAHITHLLEFARRTYRSVCVDLSGNMEKYSLELMQESKRIFLVTTQEITSLHLAREKLAYLTSLGLDDRVSVLLNRCHKRGGVPEEQVEEILGVPVYMTFPNDYQGVLRAVTAGAFLEPASDLGKKIKALARTFTDEPKPQEEGKKRFVHYFSILPARYGLTPGKNAG